VSNPYGGNPPGDQNPYGQQPYGQPYNAPDGQSFGAPAKTDAVSITAFVLSLLCCAPVGLVLGFIGLGRTKGGQRKGRWAAVTAIVLGLLGLVAWVLGAIGIAGGISFLNSVVTPGNAEVGQCVDIEEDGSSVIFTEKDCTEEHDGEIVAVEEVTSENVDLVNEQMVGYCASIIDPDDQAVLDEHPELTLQAVTEDPGDIEAGDHLACYVESDDDLTEPLL
jgi:hypothetical protein